MCVVLERAEEDYGIEAIDAFDDDMGEFLVLFSRLMLRAILSSSYKHFNELLRFIALRFIPPSFLVLSLLRTSKASHPLAVIGHKVASESRIMRACSLCKMSYFMLNQI